MSQVVLSGDSSGSVTLTVPSVAGSNTATIPAQTGTVGMIAQGTAVATTSGTSVTFTGIPSWAKRITVMMQGISTSGTSNVQIQIGSGSIDSTSTYLGSASYASTAVASALNTTGFQTDNASNAARIRHGIATLVNFSGNTWVMNSVIGCSDSALTGTGGGYKSISGTLDRVAITTVNGTDTFDAGSVNILYEG